MRITVAKTTLHWPVSYPVHPENLASPVRYFDHMPLLVEEHRQFYQVQYDDGSWANKDQRSIRHNGECNVADLDRSFGPFAPPHGPRDDVEESADLTCNYLLLHRGANSYSITGTGTSDFGWEGDPK